MISMCKKPIRTVIDRARHIS
nr:unnamed protein product [Callosobruchus chinensis]